MDKATTVLLIRHGMTDYVQRGALAGRLPGVHINAEGQRQADETARRLASAPLQAVYSSPLERALDTARSIAACHKLDVEVRDRLIEGDPGEWTGKLIRDLEVTEAWKQIQTQPSNVRVGGTGETIAEVQQRMVAEIELLIRSHPGGTLALVSHADPIKAALAHYMGMRLDDYQRLVILPASVSVLVFDPSGVKVVQVNETGKLALQKARPPAREAATGTQEGAGRVEANVVHELNPVTHLTVGAIGEPGQRTFFLQGRQGLKVITLKVEKEQVQAMANGINELLERLPAGRGETSPGDYEMALSEPFEVLFQVGQLGLGYDSQSKLVVLVAYELPEEEEPATVDAVRFWATPSQMSALAKHSIEVVAAGRPTCVLCGRPIDPRGHFCPRRNGHGEKAGLV